MSFHIFYIDSLLCRWVCSSHASSCFLFGINFCCIYSQWLPAVRYLWGVVDSKNMPKTYTDLLNHLQNPNNNTSILWGFSSFQRLPTPRLWPTTSCWKLCWVARSARLCPRPPRAVESSWAPNGRPPATALQRQRHWALGGFVGGGCLWLLGWGGFMLFWGTQHGCFCVSLLFFKQHVYCVCIYYMCKKKSNTAGFRYVLFRYTASG